MQATNCLQLSLLVIFRNVRWWYTGRECYIVFAFYTSTTFVAVVVGFATTHNNYNCISYFSSFIVFAFGYTVFSLVLSLPPPPCPCAPCHSLWHNSPNSVLSTKQKHVLYNFLYAWHKSRSIIYLFLSLSLSLSISLSHFVLLAHVWYACLILCSFFCHVVLLIIIMHFIAAVVVLCLLLLFFCVLYFRYINIVESLLIHLYLQRLREGLHFVVKKCWKGFLMKREVWYSNFFLELLVKDFKYVQFYLLFYIV